MKTIDEVIEALNNCADVNANYEACECCEYRDIRDDGYDCGRLQMMEDALQYLKEFKRISARLEKIALGNITETLEKLDNPALTWDELRTMEGKPVWYEHDFWKGWIILGKAEQTANGEMIADREDKWYIVKDGSAKAYRKERT